MSTINKIGSTFTIPSATTTVNIEAVVDADTFRKAIWIEILSVKENKALPVFSVYPNPGNGDMTIKVTGNKPQRVRVLDLGGRTVYSATPVFTDNKYRLQLDIPSGQYLLCLEEANGSQHYEQISIRR